MKKTLVFLLTLLLMLTLIGCSDGPNTDMPNTPDAQAPEPPDLSEATKLDAIPFDDWQLYGVAYLGYEEMEDLTFYVENYLDHENLPIHYISSGEFYLIIPRYANMAMRLYRNDHESAERILVYEDAVSRPFIIQCNISDIFADAVICLTYQTETAEFSPYISLADGSVVVGEYGLDITNPLQ